MHRWTEAMRARDAYALADEIESEASNPAKRQVAKRMGRRVKDFRVTPEVTRLLVDSGAVYLGFPGQWSAGVAATLRPGIVLTEELPQGVP